MTIKRKDYLVQVKIIDRQMKIQGSKEHVNWTETIDADGFEGETQVELAIIMQLSKMWPTRQYDFEIVSIEEKLIQKPHIILPGE